MKTYPCEIHNGTENYVGEVELDAVESLVLEELVRHHEALLNLSFGMNDEDRENLLVSSSRALGCFMDNFPDESVQENGGSCSVTVDGVTWRFAPDPLDGNCITRTEPAQAKTNGNIP